MGSSSCGAMDTLNGGTLINSTIVNGQLTNSSIQGSEFASGRIIGSTIDNGTITNSTMTGGRIKNSDLFTENKGAVLVFFEQSCFIKVFHDTEKFICDGCCQLVP